MTVEQYLREMHVTARELFPDVGLVFCAVEEPRPANVGDRPDDDLEPDEVASVGVQFQQIKFNFDEGAGTSRRMH